MYRMLTTTLALLAFGAGAANAQDDMDHAMHAREAATTTETSVPLYDDLGSHHYGVTASESAQAYFDQGLRLTWGFNHAEAIRAFEEAARLDPGCAMCWWGVAFAYGPNINMPMDSTAGEAAYDAIQKAKALAPKVSEPERAVIEATAKRYASPPPAERAALDSAYARAIGEVAERFPDDLEIATLHADALMNLSPWYYWTHDGEPRPDTPTIVARLENAIEENPNHPGACHLYIHAVEAVEPEKAVPCAERLAQLMPGAGHIVHMPGHIYIRVGRFADAIAANEHAVHADETYIQEQRPTGVYPALYYPHNYHFLSFAATMIGRGQQAIDAARFVSEKIPVEMAAGVPDLQQMLSFYHLTLVTFGRWDEVLATPSPAPGLTITDGLVHYSRGVAFAATDRLPEAEAELAEVAKLAAKAPDNDAGRVLPIAEHALRGEIASRRGDLDEAIAHFEKAAALEDELEYIEPPRWYYPIRHSLGAVLLRAGKPAEAERVYREDLERFPGNGWALFGLAESLEAQGKTKDAAEVRAEFERVWNEADLELTASRL